MCCALSLTRSLSLLCGHAMQYCNKNNKNNSTKHKEDKIRQRTTKYQEKKKKRNRTDMRMVNQRRDDKRGRIRKDCLLYIQSTVPDI